MLISSLVGKTVLSRSGERFGYVLALRPTRDMKKLSCLVCADEDEEEFFLPARAVLSVEDAVIAGRQRTNAPTGIPSPIGSPVYTHTGEQLGKNTDIDTGDSPALILFSNGEEHRIDVSCAAMDETVIVYPTAEDRRSAGSRRTRLATSGRTSAKKTSSASAEKSANINKNTQQKNIAPVQEFPKIQPKQPEPLATSSKVSQPAASAQTNSYQLNRTNLLGKRLKKSVFDDQGKPIALTGERITPEILARARRSNRLLELTVNTLTNLF